MMEMTPLGDAIIGDLESGYGISVEERKRLTIGMELVAKPHILFLDGISPSSRKEKTKTKTKTKTHCIFLYLIF
jgi:ABC-type multidrug transport system ATPase subunit